MPWISLCLPLAIEMAAKKAIEEDDRSASASKTIAMWEDMKANAKPLPCRHCGEIAGAWVCKHCNKPQYGNLQP